MPTTHNSMEFRGTVVIETHGCKLNQADSDALARRFLQAGYRVVGEDEPADIYVVNTCTVTHVADRKARHALRATRRRNPTATVIATGCYAQREPAALARVDGVDLVVSNQEKDRLVALALAERVNPIGPGTVGKDRPPVQPSLLGRSRVMVKIQEGCDQVCAYCIVPRVRGRERSIPPDALVEQVRARVAEGYREVVLTGTQLGSYGFDMPGTDLPGLIRRVLDETALQRLRVSSLQPQEVSPELLKLWGDSRLCPHFHMPLQSGSDSVLQRMRRRYSTGLYASVVDCIRSTVSGASVTADIIVGFPGETEEEFRESVEFVRTMGFAGIHVFPYSVRPGTSAAHLGGHLDPAAKRSRMDIMLRVAKERERDFVDRALGTVRPVLWERPSALDGMRAYRGITDNYIKVVAESDSDLTNRITRALLLGAQGEAVYAQVLEDE